MAAVGVPVTILMAEDDLDDQLLVKEAFNECRLGNEIRFVADGEELMEYLHRRGRYASKESSPRPGLILLDLNMPRKDGRQALKEIKEDPDLRIIPVIVLTTSKAEEDIVRCYRTGAASYIAKPSTFEKLVDIIRFLARYWFQVVELPDERSVRK